MKRKPNHIYIDPVYGAQIPKGMFGIARFERKSEWHGVKDELPPDKHIVLIIDDEGLYDVAYYGETSHLWWGNSGIPEVKYWMELPLPPKDNNAP